VGATLGRVFTLSPFGSFDGYDVANGLAEETPDLTTPSMGASVEQKSPAYRETLVGATLYRVLREGTR
jgi:hypothetical protein